MLSYKIQHRKVITLILRMGKKSEPTYRISSTHFLVVISLIILVLGSILSLSMFYGTQLGEISNAAALVFVVTIIISGTLLIGVSIRR